MNDYNLINNLLEDGSESSLLKLKMIVDFNTIDLDLISDECVVKFATIYKENIEKEMDRLSGHPNQHIVVDFFSKKLAFKLASTVFKDRLRILLSTIPCMLKMFSLEDIKLAIEMFRWEIILGFENESSQITCFQDDEKQELVMKLLPEFDWTKIIEDLENSFYDYDIDDDCDEEDDC